MSVARREGGLPNVSPKISPCRIVDRREGGLPKGINPSDAAVFVPRRNGGLLNFNATKTCANNTPPAARAVYRKYLAYPHAARQFPAAMVVYRLSFKEF